MELQVEVGKYYRTRDGRKVGPMELELDGDFMANHPDRHGFTVSWQPNGKRYKCDPNIDLIAEWTDTPKTWGEMTDAEKGALLLAYHEGKVIEWKGDHEESFSRSSGREGFKPIWCDRVCYRIKPEPVVEEVVLYGSYDNGQWVFGPFNDGIHSVAQTFTTTDGKPDCDSITMERIND